MEDTQNYMWKKKQTTSITSKMNKSNEKVTVINGKLKFQRSPICANCLKGGGVAIFECATYKAVDYCSRKCQKEHWPRHKEMCQRKSQFQDELNKNASSKDKIFVDLLEKWKNKSTIIPCVAIHHALKKKGMKQQPPTVI